MTEMQPKLTTPWELSLAKPAAGETALGGAERWTGVTVPTPWPASYGGDLCVGALSAIARSAGDAQLPHSLQVAFLRPGDRDAEVTYEVDRLRDGFRYANRAVAIRQTGTLIATGTASLRSPRAGEQNVTPASDLFPAASALPSPDALPTAAAAIAERGDVDLGDVDLGDEDRAALLDADRAVMTALDAYWAADRALDTRHIDPPLYGATVEARTHNRLWVRFAAEHPAQVALLATPAGRAALIAYLADDTILEPAIASLGLGWHAPGLFSTTVQQNVWFHANFDPADWLFFSQRLTSRSGDHVVCEGGLFTPSGKRVASVVQEGIVRLRPAARGV